MCVRACAQLYALRIVSMDKILHFTITLIIIDYYLSAVSLYRPRNSATLKLSVLFLLLISFWDTGPLQRLLILAAVCGQQEDISPGTPTARVKTRMNVVN